MRDLTDSTNPPDGEPPDVEAWEDPSEVLRGESIRERIVDVILQVREPTKVSEIADRADCDTETAREYLQWFAAMGMVREHEGRPVRYERNESYLRWRRIQRIRDEHTEAEIVAKLEGVAETLETYRDRFGVDSPHEVSLLDTVDESIEETWEALSSWKTAERRAALLEAARRAEATPDEYGFGAVDA